MHDIVIVGASLAGIRTAQALRRRSFDGRITLIGAEDQLPYDRPPLSKDFLLGKVAETDLALVPTERLDRLDLELRLGQVAESLNVAERRVALASGEAVSFDVLVVATGSVPRRLAGMDALAGVHTLRTLQDAVAIRGAFEAGARVAIIGGGFIGTEVATSARSLGLEVTIVDPVPSLMVRGIGSELGGIMAARHADNGVTLRLGRTLSRFEGATNVERLVLDDGTVVEADVVIVAIGVDPSLDWLSTSGLETTGGLSCDSELRAAEGIYAVGDVARWPSARHGGTVRLEHWTNAGDQAAAVAATITGTPTPYDPVPYVWSDQLGTRLQVFGTVRPEDELVYVVGDPSADEFVAASGGDGGLRAVVALGARRDAIRWQKILTAGAEWRTGVGPVTE
jgi:NADPH-dependent 2,4-dienoyl-CoA reductase/sulfur reductase-like enzyme